MSIRCSDDCYFMSNSLKTISNDQNVRVILGNRTMAVHYRTGTLLDGLHGRPSIKAALEALDRLRDGAPVRPVGLAGEFLGEKVQVDLVR